MRFGIFMVITTSWLALWGQAIPTKVAVIDVERVIAESAQGKEAFQRLKKLQQAKLQEAKTYEEKLANLEKKLKEQRLLLSQDKLEDLQKEYEDAQIEYKRFKDDSARELDKAKDKEMKKLEKLIFPIINAIGKEQNFALIFNKYNSGLVYAADAVDITDEVIRRLNTQITLPKE